MERSFHESAPPDGRMAMRLFIGMPLDWAFSRHAALFRDGQAGLPLRWIPLSMLHITLVPPFGASSVEQHCLELQRIARAHEPFTLVFDAVAFGPNADAPKLLWACGTAPDPLLDLVAILRDRFCPAHRGSFLLHVTLARLNRPLSPFFSGSQRAVAVSWTSSCHSLQLYRSLLYPSGARYQVLCQAPLGKDPAT